MHASTRFISKPGRWSAGCLLALVLPATATAVPPTLVFEPYALETAAHGTIPAEVAFLEVPRRHAAPEGPHMRLRVVRLPATAGRVGAAPVVYLAGGPGGSGVGTARGPRWPVFDRMRRHADVLLLDQRGTGGSDLPPACPYVEHFRDDQPLQRESALAALRTAAARCVSYWRGEGVDLQAYTTAESADDIEALRRAMGVPRVSLWGMSYGSHLAMATARRHGNGIERMLLMGPEGPDQTLKLPLAADAVLAELGAAAGKDGFADVAGSATRVLAALRKAPAQGRSMLHRGRQVTIGAFDAQLAIAAALGRRSTQQMLPLALREAEQGNHDLLATIVLSVREELGTISAMPLAMEVASGQSAQRRELAHVQAARSLFGDALAFPFPMLADGLGLVDLGDGFRAPLQTDIPVLMVAGTLDGRTPMANAEALLPTLRHASLLRVVNASHDDELWLGNARIAATIAGFMEGSHADSDMQVSVDAPVFSRSMLELLEQTTGISRWTALCGVVAMVLLLVMALAGLLRWRRAMRPAPATRLVGSSCRR